MSATVLPTAAKPAGKPARTQRPRRRLAVVWIPSENMEHQDWVAVGRSLGEWGRVSNWWVGDWLRYATTRWGEKYVEAAKITGVDAKTLRNIAYVASRFDLSRRRDNLTWTHHAEVAALEPDKQDEWLDRAIHDRLSATDLRLELRTLARVGRPTGRNGCAPDGASDPEGIVCPQCGHNLSMRPFQFNARPT